MNAHTLFAEISSSWLTPVKACLARCRPRLPKRRMKLSRPGPHSGGQAAWTRRLGFASAIILSLAALGCWTAAAIGAARPSQNEVRRKGGYKAGSQSNAAMLNLAKGSERVPCSGSLFRNEPDGCTARRSYPILRRAGCLSANALVKLEACLRLPD